MDSGGGLGLVRKEKNEAQTHVKSFTIEEFKSVKKVIKTLGPSRWGFLIVLGCQTETVEGWGESARGPRREITSTRTQHILS